MRNALGKKFANHENDKGEEEVKGPMKPLKFALIWEILI